MVRARTTLGGRAGSTLASAAFLCAALVCVAFAAGCGEDQGFVEGERLLVDECGDDGAAREFAPFRLEMTTFGVEPGADDGPLYIRGQRHGEPLTGGDGFLLTADDGGALRDWRRDNADAPLPIGATTADAAPTTIRGALLLADTCPDSYQPLELTGGTVVFEILGTENGDRVKLRFDGASVRDMRSGAIVGTGFSGEMDFEVRTGRPYRWYNP